MMTSRAPDAPKRVLIIERHALFAPYFASAVAARGLHVVGVESAPRPSALRRLQPDIVIFNAGYLGAPLGHIRTLRARLPHAHLVVYAPHGDRAWQLLARALGADAVIGPQGGEPELLAALAA